MVLVTTTPSIFTISSPGRIPAILAGDLLAPGLHSPRVGPSEVLITQGMTCSTLLVIIEVPMPPRITMRIKNPRTKCKNEPAPRTINLFGTDAS